MKKIVSLRVSIRMCMCMRVRIWSREYLQAFINVYKIAQKTKTKSSTLYKYSEKELIFLTLASRLAAAQHSQASFIIW